MVTNENRRKERHINPKKAGLAATSTLIAVMLLSGCSDDKGKVEVGINGELIKNPQITAEATATVNSRDQKKRCDSVFEALKELMKHEIFHSLFNSSIPASAKERMAYNTANAEGNVYLPETFEQASTTPFYKETGRTVRKDLLMLQNECKQWYKVDNDGMAYIVIPTRQNGGVNNGGTDNNRAYVVANGSYTIVNT